MTNARIMQMKCKDYHFINSKQYKKMGKNEFRETLTEIKTILTQKKQIKELSQRSGSSLRNVYRTFEASSFDDLVGKKLTVYKVAIEMVRELNSLQNQAKDVIKG